MILLTILFFTSCYGGKNKRWAGPYPAQTVPIETIHMVIKDIDYGHWKTHDRTIILFKILETDQTLLREISGHMLFSFNEGDTLLLQTHIENTIVQNAETGGNYSVRTVDDDEIDFSVYVTKTFR